MINYYSGIAYNELIQKAIKSCDEMECEKETYSLEKMELKKFVKQNISNFGSVDKCIIDIDCCMDQDDEILESLEMLRTMYGSMRIIIIAANRQTGDELLTKIFNLGIFDIINCQDMREIQEELIHSIRKGKQFRDAIKFKDFIPADQLKIKHVIKKAVDKVIIAVAGSEGNIGVTHHCLVLSNYLRSKGYIVAIAEMNGSDDFLQIQDDFEEKMYPEGFFTLNGVDYYPKWEKSPVLDGSYNFIVLDMGSYETCDRALFERCEEKIIITGSKSWELQSADRVFTLASEDALKKYHFCFNFTPQKDYKAIQESMNKISKQVFFLEYSEDPFTHKGMHAADEIFKPYLPEPEEEETQKKGLFGKRKKVKK